MTCGLFSPVFSVGVYVVSRGNVGRTSVTATGGLPYVVTEQKAGSGVGGVQVYGANTLFPKKIKKTKKSILRPFKAIKIFRWYSWLFSW